MRYVFFDIECADGGHGTICSFGYVITDEQFNEIFSRDITINPPGKFRLTNRPWRPDVTLAYDEEVFRNSPKFFSYYDEIKDLLEGKDKIIIGHSAKNDAGFLNKSCLRYKKPCLNFRFVDTQKIFSKIENSKKPVSLESALEHFGLPLPAIAHKSEEDARATKTLMAHYCKLKGCETVSELCSALEHISGETKDGVAVYDDPPAEENPNKRIRHRGQRLRKEKEQYRNFILSGSKNKVLFNRFIEYASPVNTVPQIFKDKKVSVSLNYERNHFKEMILPVQKIVDAGGTYVLRSSESDVFATVDGVLTAEGDPMTCNRLKYALEANQNGAKIEIVTLDELLSRLGTTKEELESAEPTDVSYLMDDKYAPKDLTPQMQS